MFDKNLFDRNAYDRSVSSDGIVGSIYAVGSMQTRIVIAYPVPIDPFVGRGRMNTDLILLTHVNSEYEGEGKMEDLELILRMPLTRRMSGSGTFNPGLVARTPFSLSLSGQGDMRSQQDFVYQHMAFTVGGQGIFDIAMVIITLLSFDEMAGFGELTGNMILELPLTINMDGTSSFLLRRLGALNENIFNLDGINLLPGEEVTIDTDLLSVFFGFRQDVSSVTTDSVFFELSPGENNIMIETDAGEAMTVTAIWQNRWL